MITTPLAPIVPFLRKHRASLACLEGAPYAVRLGGYIGSLQAIRDVELLVEGGRPVGEVMLYLGTSAICPAALGWAAQVLALARGWTGVDREDAQVYIDDDGALCLRGWNVCHEWAWKPSDPSLWDDDVDTFLITVMPGPMPTSPAERLKAVLEHEVSR